MLSQTAEYALRAAVCLAQNPEESLTTSEMSQLIKVPEPYLSKVLHDLARGGIVSSKRGPHGGYTLSRPINQLSIMTIIRVVDPVHLQQIESCPLKLNSHKTHLCALHRKINNGISQMEEVYRNATIHTILEERAKTIPLRES